MNLFQTCRILMKICTTNSIGDVHELINLPPSESAEFVQRWKTWISGAMDMHVNTYTAPWYPGDGYMWRLANKVKS